MMQARLLGAVGIVAVVGGVLVAQAPAPPAFEVASIKPTTAPGSDGGFALAPGGRLDVSNQPVRALIRYAYGIHDYQLVGGPSWIDREFFDIHAKAAATSLDQQGSIAEENIELMVQRLLADRFRLAIRREPRDMPVYALTRAHSTDSLGPQLRRAAIDCEALIAAGKTPPRATSGDVTVCGGRNTPAHITVNGFPLARLAASLSTRLQRFVLDRTALSGPFDVDLDWSSGLATADGATDQGGASIFTAVQEQLGLKLEPSRGSVDVLVIDHVERPTAD